MRYSKEHKAETRQRIVRAASRQLRERGIDGIGVADLMKAAGLTHGGFYAHFSSKEALVAEACSGALARTTERLREQAASAPKGKGAEALARSYLSPEHRDHPGRGCAIAALAPEIARQGAATRRAFAGEIDKLIETLAKEMPEDDPAARRQAAIAMLATLVGTLVLARAVHGKAASDEILEAGRAAVLKEG